LTAPQIEDAYVRASALMPERMRPRLESIRPEVCFEVGLSFASGATLLDLGGRAGFHCLVAQLAGMRTICVDNFSTQYLPSPRKLHFLKQAEIAAEHGVRFIEADIVDWDVPANLAFDHAMTHGCIEHLTQSPRRTYRRLSERLPIAGTFVIGAPNAANLLKRFRVPAGRNIFAKLDDWYLRERFHGHVREPILSDLAFIVRDIGLHPKSLIGRNWMKRDRFGPFKDVLDRVLQLRPTLCSNLYVVGERLSVAAPG